MPTLNDTLTALGVPSHSALAIGRRWISGTGAPLDVHSPIDGSRLASFPQATAADLQPILEAATSVFTTWRMVPAPVRGEFVRRIGAKLREKKELLAQVVSWEAGKITSESLGEVQEMIDICDFAVGLSRQLHGLTIASERPRHRLMEQWHPLGPVGVITAFNFPVAVWAWNAMLGLACGDPIIWKPSPKTPLCALATHAIVCDVLKEMPEVPDGVACLIVGGTDVGEAIAAAPELPLVSATGSTRMGRAVSVQVAKRLGRSLLELGGNNAMIVAPSADLELAVRSITFAAVGTCGQRCTSLRRLIVHESIAANLVERLKAVYAKLPVGNPLEAGTLVGPLIDGAAFDAMQAALESARQSGGKVFGGERVPRAGDNSLPSNERLGATPTALGGHASDSNEITMPTQSRGHGTPAIKSRESYYVRPALVEIDAGAPIVREETFAPILYVMTYRDLSKAIALQNGVPQGLASAILTNDLKEAEWFLSPAGSDCGIANVNIGTSGAEIGGAFGGEKETGGGRESGSDSWKAYMRRATNTVNYSSELPLAQGVRFDVE